MLPRRQNYNQAMFVHLRLHTEFSVVDSTNRIDEVVKARCQRRPACHGHHRPEQPVWCHQVLQRGPGQGRQAGLIGAELIIEGLGADPTAVSRVIVLVQNKQGYLNISELIARAFTRKTW